MAQATPRYGLPYPEPTDLPDVPADMRRLAEAIESMLSQYMPVGTILAWSGSGTIPVGWALCNGTGGTPNLAGKTLVGAGVATDGTHLASGQSTTYSPGQTGGRASVKLTRVTSGIGVHTHGGSVSVTVPGHTHTVPAQTVTSSASSGAHAHTGATHSNNRGHVHHGSTHGANRDHGHIYTASQAVNNTIGVAGLQDQSPNLHRGNIAIGRHSPGTAGQNVNHEHGFVSDGQNVNHEHGFTTGSAGGNHSHTVAVKAKTTSSSAPAGSANVTMSASTPQDAQQAHENRMPYYVIQYIIRVA